MKVDPPFVPARGWSIAREPPRFVGRIAKELLSGRPVISRDRCTGCMFCARNCASDAIFEEGGKAVIDRSKCSRCYCCHELCPHGAVDIKDPPKVAGALLDVLFHFIGK